MIQEQRDYYKECRQILSKFGIWVDIKSDYLMTLTHESYIVMVEQKISFQKALLRVKSRQYYQRKTAPIFQEIDNTVSAENGSIVDIETSQELKNARKMIEAGKMSNMTAKVKANKRFYIAKISELLGSEV